VVVEHAGLHMDLVAQRQPEAAGDEQDDGPAHVVERRAIRGQDEGLTTVGGVLRRAALVVLLAAFAAAVGTAPAGAAGPLKVKGGQLVDSSGRTVILHGVNVVYKLAPYLPHGSAERDSFNAKDVRRLKSWGFNTVRLGLSWKTLMPTPGVVDQAYLRRVGAITK